MAFNGIDAGLTAVMAVMAGPGIEANPLMRALLKLNVFVFLGFKVVWLHLAALFLPKLDESKTGTLTLGGLTLFYIYLVLRNTLILTDQWQQLWR